MAEGRSTGRSSGGPRKASGGRASSAAKRSAAAKKGGQARGRQQKAQASARTGARKATRPASAAGVEAKTVAEFRDALRKNLIKPTEMVFLSRERIEDALGDAVKRGRITRAHAQGLTGDLLKRGHKETNDVLKDLENLLDRGRRQASGAKRRAVRAASPALAQADRARRGAGVGANFPISLYDELTVAEIKTRLTDLTPAQLRKVRDHERRGAKRKGVLNAIESKLKK